MAGAKLWHALPADELPEGKMRQALIGGRSILICRVQGACYALDDICTHAEAQLHEGRLRGNKIICPLHGASFDCRSGAVLGGPATRPLRVYDLRVVGEQIEVAIDASIEGTPHDI
jgi:nitrite reductase/ring-hydroxylating ferredoxin subunit